MFDYTFDGTEVMSDIGSGSLKITNTTVGMPASHRCQDSETLDCFGAIGDATGQERHVDVAKKNH
jgi:hypothetical protein